MWIQAVRIGKSRFESLGAVYWPRCPLCVHTHTFGKFEAVGSYEFTEREKSHEEWDIVDEAAWLLVARNHLGYGSQLRRRLSSPANLSP